jgi:hypothetical protein
MAINPFSNLFGASAFDEASAQQYSMLGTDEPSLSQMAATSAPMDTGFQPMVPALIGAGLVPFTQLVPSGGAIPARGLMSRFAPTAAALLAAEEAPKAFGSEKSTSEILTELAATTPEERAGAAEYAALGANLPGLGGEPVIDAGVVSKPTKDSMIGTVLKEPDNRETINQVMSQANVPQLDQQVLGALQRSQNQQQFMNGGVQMPTGYGTVLKSPSQVMIGAGVPTMEENVAGMMSSTPGTAPVLPEGVQPGSPQANFLSRQASGQQMTPEQVTQAQEFAGSIGTTFDPQTGYSRDPFLQSQGQQAQEEAQRQTSLTGPLPGQSLSQFMRYEDQPIQRTEQFVEPGTGRLRRRSTEAAVDLMRQDGFDIPQGVRPLAPELAGFEQDAGIREQRLRDQAALRERFPGGVPVSSRLAAMQTGTMTDAERRRFAKGLMRGASEGDIADSLEIANRYNLDPRTGEPIQTTPSSPSSFQEKVSALIATGASPEDAVSRALGERDTAVRPSASEQKIQTIMQANPELSFTDAANIVTGVVRVVTDPVTQKTNLVNLSDGTSTPMETPTDIKSIVSSSLKPGDGEPEFSINLYEIAEETTGIVPALAAFAQRFTGQKPIGFDVADPELLENIQTFQTAQSDIRRSLRTAPKFLASEMDMLSKEIDISPGVMKDPTTLLAQLRSLDNSIRVRLKDIAEKTNDPSLPADDVRGARSLQRDLTNFLRKLGVPQDDEQPASESTEIDNLIEKYS